MRYLPGGRLLQSHRRSRATVARPLAAVNPNRVVHAGEPTPALGAFIAQSAAAGVLARTLEADRHVVVVVGLVADDAVGRAAAVRVLEDPVEAALADAIVQRPVVEDALDVEVEEDHLAAAIVVAGGGVAVRLLEVEQADVDVAAGLVRVVLGDEAAGLRGDVADREDVLVGEGVEGLADRAQGELDRGLGAERALGAAEEVAVAGRQRRGALQAPVPRRADALAVRDLARLDVL